MNTQNQIKYWQDGAESDLESAFLLINNHKILNGLFFCHLSIEKILKAHVTKTTQDFPPKTHNLIRLMDIAEIVISQDDINLLGILMVYQLEGRYPDYYPATPTKEYAEDVFLRSKKLLACLREKL
jgi:HEPN domain-containing protein